MLEAAVVAGLTSAGAEVLRAGVLPTPALALPDRPHRRRPRRHDLGQPQPDARQRHQAVQPRRAQAARRRRGRDRARPSSTAASTTTGRPAPASAASATCRGAAERLRRPPARHASTQPLDGLRVVVDCAHGAAAAIAPEVYRRAGATVHAIGGEPDGWNINDGIGSTHLGPLIEAVARARRRPRHRPRRRRRPLPGRHRRRRRRRRRRDPGHLRAGAARARRARAETPSSPP